MIPQKGPIADAIQAFFYAFLRLMPSEVASAIGSYGIRANARLSRLDIITAAKNNLRIHRPQASPAEIDGMVDEFLDGVGRVAAEFAVMHRFLDEGRITMIGAEAFKAVANTRPIIALCVHTGNWEVFSPAFQRIGIQLNSIIMPPASAFERFAVNRARLKFGVNPILPDRAGIRQAIRALKANGVVSMFPDEAREGHTMGPLFGRPPHEKGNFAIAAKLGRMTGAAFAIGHCKRVGTCRFELNFGELFELPARAEPDILADVVFLNSKIEPVILANIPRWYFLDDSIAPI